MEKRVLLREGNSIRENKFSYDKEVSMEKELLYEAKFSLWKKECYYEKEVLFWKTKKTIFQNSFLRHPKFQDLEKNKKTKRTKKNIISELFLETPQIPRPRKKKKKKHYFRTLSWDTPNSKTSGKLVFFVFFVFFGFLQALWNFFCFFWFSARPLENCFFCFFCFFCFLQDLWKIGFVGFWRKYCRCSSTCICRDHFLWEFHWKITFYLGFGTLISIKHCKTQWFWCVLSGKSHPHEHPFCFLTTMI